MTNSGRIEKGDISRPSYLQARIQQEVNKIIFFEMNGFVYGLTSGRFDSMIRNACISEEEILREQHAILVMLNDMDSPVIRCLELTEKEQDILRKAKTQPELENLEGYAFDDLVLSTERVKRGLEFPRDQLNTQETDVEAIPNKNDQVQQLLKLLIPTVEDLAPNSPLRKCMLIEPLEMYILTTALKRQLDNDESKILERILQDVTRIQRALKWKITE